MAQPDSGATCWPALMARAQAGDRAAYNQLLKAMVPAIRGFVRKKIQDEALVEDVVQESLIAIHRVRHTYDPQRPILPWIAAIAAARAIDALRQRGRRREVQDDDALQYQVADQDATDNTPQADKEQLTGYLGHLPPRQREIIESVHLQEHTLAEAAAERNLTVPAVKSLLHRAMLNLRKLGNGHHEKS